MIKYKRHGSNKRREREEGNSDPERRALVTCPPEPGIGQRKGGACGSCERRATAPDAEWSRPAAVANGRPGCWSGKRRWRRSLARSLAAEGVRWGRGTAAAAMMLVCFQ